ncbi:MAG: hypothetical protein A2Y95_11310 [Deltaproteobacteria bacterium RBG_13_65_10]|nr:MAG: hypothetical protein A2Y95_11310 [Deltaproteobacteria bacterium RBG_13_65_10]
MRVLRANRAAALALLPPRLHHYLQGRIMVSVWYPEEDYLDLLRALSRILPKRNGSIYEFMGRQGARMDLKGVYRHMVFPGDPAATLKRCALYWHNYHDTGRCLVTIEGPGQARVDITSYEMTSPEMCEVQLGWYLEALRIAGAPKATIQHTRCVMKKEPWCRYEVRWQASRIATPESPAAR